MLVAADNGRPAIAPSEAVLVPTTYSRRVQPVTRHQGLGVATEEESERSCAPGPSSVFCFLGGFPTDQADWKPEIWQDPS